VCPRSTGKFNLRTWNIKLLYCPVLSDIRETDALCEVSQASPICHSDMNSIDMSMGHWQHNTDRGKPEYLDINLPHCHFTREKSHINWPGIEPVSPL
jgi:folate-dependent tRNA-U54 methylase TrmFO/GidA